MIGRKKKYPFLLVQKGKHGDSYYHITDEESYLAALLDIFNTNDEIGYYGHSDPALYANDIAEGEAIIAQLTPVFNQLEPGLAKNDMKRHISNAQRKIAHAQESLEEAANLEKIRAGDKTLVAKFVLDRSDGEYEGVEEEWYSNVEPE